MGSKLDKIKKDAPHLLEEAQAVKDVLEKINLGQHQAQVALCLDISGTMHHLYTSGEIQEFAEKILALGSRFDSNAAIDIFLFGDRAYSVGEMNTSNFHNFVLNAKKNYQSAGGTFYGKAIKLVRDFYFPHGDNEERTEIIKTKEPVYVMFLTDGTTVDEEETVKQLIWASYEPIFWQFMAIGKSKDDFKGGFWDWVNKPFAEDFSFLKMLDTMENRYIDNANFFNVIAPLKLDDEELYRSMLQEYPEWVAKAKEKKMIE